MSGRSPLEQAPAITPPPNQPDPLTPAQLRALAAARTQAGKVRRAAAVAAFSGWSLVLFALITLAGVLFGSLSALILGAALGAIAWNELRAGAMLTRLDPRAPRRLALNQLALGALIVLYSGWSLYGALTTTVLDSVGGTTGDPNIDALVTDLSRTVSVALYGTLAFLGVLIPGLTAWYYATRARCIRAMFAEHPAWAVEAVRVAA